MSTAEELYDEALLEVSRENADIDKVVLMLRKSREIRIKGVGDK